MKDTIEIIVNAVCVCAILVVCLREMLLRIFVVIYWDKLKQKDMNQTTLKTDSEYLKTKIRQAIVEYKKQTGLEKVDISTYTYYTENGDGVIPVKTEVTINITE